MSGAGLPLRDVHVPPAPPWWPPAPGWWAVAGVVLALLLGWAIWRWYARRRRRLAAALFDRTVAAAPTPAEEVAAISALLRRAARRIEPGADTLEGEAWLELLDRGLPRGFRDGPGRLLHEGAFRPRVDAGEVERLRPLARARFIDWMQRR